MELFPLGRVYDFMKYQRVCVGLSLVMMLGSIALMFVPGPRLGTDFRGGTEMELLFEKPVSVAQIDDAVMAKGFSRPEVIRVEEDKSGRRYLLRVQEVSTIPEATQRAVEAKLCFGENVPADCPHPATEVKFSPGGEKITARFVEAPDLGWVKSQLAGISGIELQARDGNPSLQNARDHRVEILLRGKSDQLMSALREGLEPGSVPAAPLRTEWLGPKAGKQLRDAAVKSVLISLLLIMVYVAFRFDLRFAPGGVLALAHDAVVTIGVLIVIGKEVNLTTIAAILTIIGYSVNDTVVVYDRVRENMAKHRGMKFKQLINLSLSEMLSRSILASSTVIMVLLCFFIWGTGALKDFALTLIIGLVLGAYSSIYVALPITELQDRLFFSGKGKRAKAA